MTPSIVLFFSLCAALCMALALVVILPWMYQKRYTDNRLMHLNVNTFYQRLAELEEDYAAGTISQSVHQAQVVELKRQLLAAEQVSESMRPVSIKSRLIILVWIPLLAAMAYLLVQDRAAVFTLWQAQDSVGQIADELMTGKLDTPPEWATKDSAALISAIQTNVHHHAYDADRWMRLSELFLSLDAKPQALEALARAYRLSPDNEEIASTYAQISFFSNDGRLDETSRQVLTDILSKNPNHEGAQMLMAMGETRAGNFVQAQAWVARLRSAIAAKSGDHSAALASLDKLSATIDEQAQKAATGVAVTVEVDSKLLAQVQQTDVLFVSISDVAGGPPYAVQRLGVDVLKQGRAEVTLSNLNAMMPERTLSAARDAGVKLALSARISKSGQAISQSGDLSANPVPLSQTQTQAQIVINQVVP